MFRLNLIALVALGACSGDSTLTVVNQETFAITDLYVDAVGDEAFSDNLLGNVPLQPGSAIRLSIDCGTYDVEIIDEAGGDCLVKNTDLCFSNAHWYIDDSFCTFTSREQPKPPSLAVERGGAQAAR